MRFPTALLLSCLAVGCGDNQYVGFDTLPGFRLTTTADGGARLEATGDHLWWWNSMPETDYQSWATVFDEDSWRHESAAASIALIKPNQQPLTARLELDGGHELEFVHIALGFGWRALYPAEGDSREFDPETAGLAPDDGSLDEDHIAACKVTDARVLVALSSYPGTMDELIAAASDSAAEQGLPEPIHWSDIVHDEVMYELLFGAHRTQSVDDATFAFMSLQIDPLCGSLRLAFRTEKGLVGPVERAAP